MLQPRPHWPERRLPREPSRDRFDEAYRWRVHRKGLAHVGSRRTRLVGFLLGSKGVLDLSLPVSCEQVRSMRKCHVNSGRARPPAGYGPGA